MRHYVAPAAWGSVLGIALALLSCVARAADAPAGKAEAPISATDLSKAFQQDEAAAGAKFKDKSKTITGTAVGPAFQNSANEWVLMLDGSGGKLDIQCALDDKAQIVAGQKVQRGQNVAVTGVVTGPGGPLAMTLLVQHCPISDKPPAAAAVHDDVVVAATDLAKAFATDE